MAAETLALHHGLRLAQRYQLAERVGHGALTMVYRGQDLVLRRPIAVKAAPPEHVEVYQAALRDSSTLAHPAAICIYDALMHDGWLFVVQEFVAARPISGYFRQGVPIGRAVDLARQIASALAHAHTHGVVHGDLTPTAILVDRNANVRLNNFGLPPDTAYFASMAAAVAASLQSDEPIVALLTSNDASNGASGGRSDIADRDAPPAPHGPNASALVSPAGDIRAVGYLLWQLLTEPVMTAAGAEPDEGLRRFRAEAPMGLREVVVNCIAASPPLDDPYALALALERISHDLAQTRPVTTAATPPAILAARAAAHEAAWSAEETMQSGRHLWSTAHPAARTVPESAALAPEPVGARAIGASPGDWAASPAHPPARMHPGAERISQASGEAPLWATSGAQAYDEQAQRVGIPLIALLALGAVLFILFFLVGYFSVR